MQLLCVWISARQNSRPFFSFGYFSRSIFLSLPFFAVFLFFSYIPNIFSTVLVILFHPFITSCFLSFVFNFLMSFYFPFCVPFLSCVLLFFHFIYVLVFFKLLFSLTQAFLREKQINMSTPNTMSCLKLKVVRSTKARDVFTSLSNGCSPHTQVNVL